MNRTGKFAPRLGCSLLLLGASAASQAATTAIDSLDVTYATVTLEGLVYTPLLGAQEAYADQNLSASGLDITVEMGAYQSSIYSAANAFASINIYTSNADGNPPPTGSVDLAVYDSILVDTSSLRATITVDGLVWDGPLWPLSSPFDSATFDPGDLSYSLSWNRAFSVSAAGLGTLDGAVDVTVGGTVAPVPAPAAVWLFGVGLAGLAAMGRRAQKQEFSTAPSTRAAAVQA